MSDFEFDFVSDSYINHNAPYRTVLKRRDISSSNSLKLIDSINHRLLTGKNGFQRTTYRRVCFFDSFAFGHENLHDEDKLTTKMYQCLSKKVQKRGRLTLSRMYNTTNSNGQETTDGYLVTQQKKHRMFLFELHEDCGSSFKLAKYIPGKSLPQAIMNREIGQSRFENVPLPSRYSDQSDLNHYFGHRNVPTEITFNLFQRIQKSVPRRRYYCPVSLLKRLNNRRTRYVAKRSFLGRRNIDITEMIWYYTHLNVI